MYNKKVLIDSLKKLGSAKAPAQKKDIIVDLNNPTQMLSMKKGGSSVDKRLSVRKSNIQGKGLFIDQPIKKGEIIGLAHVNNQATPVVGKYHNHSEDNPTAINISKGNKRYLVAARNLPAGTEITTNYRLQPDLEQPEDFMQKGGMTPQKDGYRTYSPFKHLPFIDVESDTIDTDNIVYDLQLVGNNGVIKNVEKNSGLHSIPGASVIREIPIGRKGDSTPKLPKKKNSRAYSRSLEATNRFFAEHAFFAQPKSRKNKIYDPNAKYYQGGGTIWVENEDDPRYKDYLIRQALYNYSNNPNFNLRSWGALDLSSAIQNNDFSDFNNTYYDTLLSNLNKDKPSGDLSDDDRDFYESLIDQNVGPYGSNVNYQTLGNDQLHTDHDYNDAYFWLKDLEQSNDFFKNYPPINWQKKQSYASEPYGFNYQYLGPTANYTNWTKPSTLLIEDKINRNELKKVYPNLTDAQIDKWIEKSRKEPPFLTRIIAPGGYATYADTYNNQQYIANPNKKTFIDANGNIGYLPEEMVDRPRRDYDYIPTWGKPETVVKVLPPPIKIGPPPTLEHGELPELQPGNYFSEPLPEAPQYTLYPYTDKRLRLVKTPGKTKWKTHRTRLGDGQKYKWTTGHSTKDLEFRRKEVTKPIAALVQKLTGYDPKYFEGYYDEEDNYTPGELDYGNLTGAKLEFKGAASLRDFINQQKYKKEYEEYQKKLDERYEQSKKKQAEGIAFKYGGLSKFFDGGPQCPEDYTYNPETKRCERQRTDCPEGYVWDAQEGRCKSIAYREKSQLYSKGNKIVPTEEQEKYSWWPDDLTIKHLDPNTALIHPSKRLEIYKPGVTDFSNEWTPAIFPIYPDLNYEVIVDPSKPKGYNADKSIYYVPDENNLEFEKFKQYKKLKEVEKENLENLSRYPELTTSIINEDWGDKNSDPDYFQNPNTADPDDQITYDDYTNSKKNKYQECTDCSYGHGETFSYDDGYKNTEQNLGHVYNKFHEMPDYETRFEREYDYLDLPKESMIPKIDLESEDGYLPDWNESKDRGYIRGIHFDKGNTKSIKINLPKYHKHWMQTDAPPFHGTDPHYIKWKPIKGIETWKRESTKPRLIPRIVQKKTGYDPNYYYGYDKEIGDETIHVPGELEKAEQEGRPINFKGAKTFRDIKKQKEYNEKRVQYEKEKNDVRQRNEKYLEEYGISPEEYEQQYGAFRRGGQLPKAQDGIPQEFYQNWYQNRIMPTPEGQKLLDKIRPEALERSRQMIPYIYSDKLKPDDAGYYDTKTQEIILNKFLPEAQIEATKQHEFGHHIQAGDKFYNVLDKPHQFLVEQNIIEPEKINTGNSEWDEKLKENYDYVTQPDEMHARVMTLRRLAGFQPNQVITEKDLKDYFNRVKEAGEALDPDIEDLRGVTKGNQSIVNLLNDMVSVPSNREDLNIAQFGGSKENCPLGFIWNGIECIPNPFETRPSQRAAIYMDKDGTYKMDPVYQQYSQQKFDVAQSNKKAQDFNKMYAQSKNYKRLLKKQGYTPEEIDDRINSVMNVNDFRYIDQGQSWVGTDENTGKEFISYNVTDPGDWPGFDQIAAHEWGHVGVDSGANPLKKKEREEFINRINKKQAGVTGNPDDLVHDMEPQENRADLLQLRQQLQEAGVFDSTKRKRFTKKDLDKYRKLMESSERNWDNMWNRMFRLYDDDSIIYFMNNVAKNDFDDNLQVAKQGLELDLSEDEIKKYVDGGYIVEDISVPSLTKMKKGGLPCPPFCSPLIELSKGLSTIARNIPKTNSLNKFIANAATLADESLGQAFLSKSNAEAIAKGNQWLNSWIQHPTTQMKIKADMLDVINNKNLNKNSIIYTTPRYGDIVLSPKDQYIGALQIAQNYAPDVTPYSTKFSLSNLKQNKLNPMVDNIGISYTHQSDPIMRSLYSHGYFKPYSTQIDTEYKPFEHYGSFVSQSPKYSPYRKELTTIHEGTHDWISNKLLNETGQSDLILSNIDPEVKKLSDQLSLDPNAPLTKEEKKLIYLAKPTEVHARIMELRRHNNLSPSDYVDEDMAKHYLEDINNNKSAIDSEFSKVINNDPKILSKLMNDLYNIAIPLGVGIGGAALLKNPYKEESPIGGYKMGGEFELGDEVDEATMKELKKLGFTFQKI